MFLKLRNKTANTIAVITDIHSNIEALKAVLKRVKKLKPDSVVCLGDIVGYNANPNECVDIIRKKKIRTIMGNHDAVACGLEEPTHFNENARRAILWTRNTLTQKNRDFLAGLKNTYSVEDGYAIAHGSPRKRDEYIFTNQVAFKNLNFMKKNFDDTKVCFFGHTHIKCYFSSEGRSEKMKDGNSVLQLSPEHFFLINPGSVGQPRDEDTRASFVILNKRELTAKYEFVEYDVETASEKVRKANLPEKLADRLLVGK